MAKYEGPIIPIPAHLNEKALAYLGKKIKLYDLTGAVAKYRTIVAVDLFMRDMILTLNLPCDEVLRMRIDGEPNGHVVCLTDETMETIDIGMLLYSIE